LKRAFSLVELLVVITIILILLFLSFPGLLRWKERFFVKNFCYELSAKIGNSRDYARRFGERVILAVTKDEAKDWTGNSDLDPVVYLIFVDKNKNGAFDTEDEILFTGSTKRIRVLENEVGYNCFGGQGRCIVFFPVGIPKIGAISKSIVFSSAYDPTISYAVRFRSITGISEVVRK